MSFAARSISVIIIIIKLCANLMHASEKCHIIFISPCPRGGGGGGGVDLSLGYFLPVTPDDKIIDGSGGHTIIAL